MRHHGFILFVQAPSSSPLTFNRYVALPSKDDEGPRFSLWTKAARLLYKLLMGFWKKKFWIFFQDFMWQIWIVFNTNYGPKYSFAILRTPRTTENKMFGRVRHVLCISYEKWETRYYQLWAWHHRRTMFSLHLLLSLQKLLSIAILSNSMRAELGEGVLPLVLVEYEFNLMYNFSHYT